MTKPPCRTRTAFVVFRYVPKVQDAVDVVKMYFQQLSDRGEEWQIEILGPSLPSGKILLTGVLEAVKRADLVIIVAGEISHNVAFELGLAYAFDKDMILLAPEQIVEEIPKTFSDISGVKCAVYDVDRIMKLPVVLEREMQALNANRTTKVTRALSPDYLIALGDLLQLEGLYDEAITKYQAACDLDDKNIRYLVRLGQAYATTYDLHRAEEVLRGAVSLDPKCVMALDALSQVLLDAGKYQAAIDECLLMLISLSSRKEPYYFKVAVAYTELGRPDKAANFLEEAISKSSNLPRLYYDLAWTAVRASKKSRMKKREDWILKGLEALTKAIKLEPGLAKRAETDQDFDPVRTRKDFPV